MFKTVILSLLLLAGACKSNNNTSQTKTTSKSKIDYQKEIESLASTLAKKAANAPLDLITANQLIDQSQAYFKNFPNDKNSASYLFRAADVGRGIGSYKQAIQIWGDVQTHFPNYNRVGDALFLQGFTYENNLNDKENAKKCYLKFLSLYPNHNQRKTVQLSLENIDASPEELIKKFKDNR